jgi:pectate lyase
MLEDVSWPLVDPFSTMWKCPLSRVNSSFDFQPGASGNQNDTVQTLQMLNCTTDNQAHNPSCRLATNGFATCTISNCTFTGCGFSGSIVGDGVLVEQLNNGGPITNLTFFGSTFWNNQNAGLALTAGDNILVSCCSFYSNGRGTGGEGLLVDGASNVSIVSTASNGMGGRSASQEYGLKVTSNVANQNILIDNCDVTGNANPTGTLPIVIDTAVAANVQATNNLGYNPVGWITPPTVHPVHDAAYQNKTGTPLTIYIASTSPIPTVSIGKSSSGVTLITTPPPLGSAIRLGVGEWLALGGYTGTPITWHWYAD